MLVKTLRAHSNGYGKPYKKEAGAEYDHPNPSVLIGQKIVEEVSDVNGKDGGVRGDGRSSLPTKEVDSEEHGREDNGKKPRADKGTRDNPRAKRQEKTRGSDSDKPASNKEEET